VGFHAGQQREGAVFQFHHHALERLLGLLVGDFQQLQDDGLVLAQHFAGGDAEQQGVTDLACGAGDGNADGLFAHGKSPEGSKNGKPALADRLQTGSRPVCKQPASVPAKTLSVNLSYVLYKI
jgi:hypothetical protein